MSRRLEFTRTTKLAAYDRSGGDCECGCGVPFDVKNPPEYDHIIACEIEPDNSLENCQVLRRCCHQLKTKKDIKVIAKGRSVRAKHRNATNRKSRPLPGSKDSGWKHTLNNGWVRR